MRDYEIGWRAISRYTGISVNELQAADAAGELRYEPLASRRHLDGWLRMRALRRAIAEFADQAI